MSDGEFSFIRIVMFNPFNNKELQKKRRRTRKACIVESAYGAQDLLYARAEATYARQAVLLKIER